MYSSTNSAITVPRSRVALRRAWSTASYAALAVASDAGISAIRRATRYVAAARRFSTATPSGIATVTRMKMNACCQPLPSIWLARINPRPAPRQQQSNRRDDPVERVLIAKDLAREHDRRDEDSRDASTTAPASTGWRSSVSVRATSTPSQSATTSASAASSPSARSDRAHERRPAIAQQPVGHAIGFQIVTFAAFNPNQFVLEAAHLECMSRHGFLCVRATLQQLVGCDRAEAQSQDPSPRRGEGDLVLRTSGLARA